MKNTVFYVSMRIPDVFEEEEYSTQAGTMLHILSSVFNDVDKMKVLLGKCNAESVHTEAEVSQDENGLIGKAVVDILAETKVSLDKSKLSAMLKALSPWEHVKIEKRGVQMQVEAGV